MDRFSTLKNSACSVHGKYYTPLLAAPTVYYIDGIRNDCTLDRTSHRYRRHRWLDAPPSGVPEQTSLSQGHS